MKAIKEQIELFTARDKCWMCKHKFEKPVLLPVKKPERDKFQPNINVEVLFHMNDTHGIPPDIQASWIVGAVYGQELTEFGVRSEPN